MKWERAERGSATGRRPTASGGPGLASPQPPSARTASAAPISALVFAAPFISGRRHAHPLAKDPPRGQLHKGLGGVVVGVRFPPEAAGVDDLDEGEAAAQAGDVYPLFGVAVRVDVRPADGGAETVSGDVPPFAAAGVDGL